MGELKNMKLANANFKNYIFNKNKTLISKELFDRVQKVLKERKKEKFCKEQK